MAAIVNRAGALAVGLALMAAMFAPGGASASGIQKATFKVKVEGVQTTSWKTDHPGGGGCDSPVTGSGTETVRFAARPVRVQALATPGLSAPVFTALPGNGLPGLRLRGTIARQGTLDAAPNPLCGGTGGGSIARDCGTRSFTGVVLPLAYRLTARPRDQLDLQPSVMDEDPFVNCPSAATAFPTLVHTNEGEGMRTDLPRGELFDASLGRIIVIARGRESEAVGEHTYLTTTRWVVTFDRLKKRRQR
jgi:hypothetical protein